MNSIDDLDKKQIIVKYGKYILLLLLALIILLIFKSCGQSSSKLESQVIEAAKKYVAANKLVISGQKYIELSKLGEIKGTELCSKTSGVIIVSENGDLIYKPYLKCDDYQSKIIINNTKIIKLVGDDIIVLNKGEIYNEQYYTLTGDAEVKISGAVGTEPGIYRVNYDVYVDNNFKERAYRLIIVSETDKGGTISGITNPNVPVITLLGDKEIVINKGEKYVEPGYRAVDYKDGKISRDVKVEGKVNNKVVGTYQLVYSVTNSKGVTAKEIRTVKVVEKKGDIDIKLTTESSELAKSVTINVRVDGKDYESMKLPDGTVWYLRDATYKATANTIYKFRIYDRYKNEYIKEIEINTIDSIPPSAICSAIVKGSNTEIEVKATDNKGISGYLYILDNVETGYITASTYKLDKAVKEVSVKVKDIVGNESTTKCDVTIKQETTTSGRPSGSSLVIDTSEYKLVSTKNDVVTFAKLVSSLNIAQNHPPTYPDYCLAFAYYHAYMLNNGTDLEKMNAPDGASYMHAAMFKGIVDDSKEVILRKIYEVINQGQPLVLQVNGNKKGTSRHYVTVVGYKASVTSANSLTEQDLLIIDSYDGLLERMDRDTSRFMISGHDTGRTGSEAYGYQIYVLR